MRLIDALGFDPVDGGRLENGRLLEPGGSPYAITYTGRELGRRLASGAASRVARATTPAVTRVVNEAKVHGHG